jgi:hypothetical protein
MDRQKSNFGMVVKKNQFAARKSQGRRRTPLHRSDFEMQRNAEIGLFAEPSSLTPGGGTHSKTPETPAGRRPWRHFWGFRVQGG